MLKISTLRSKAITAIAVVLVFLIATHLLLGEQAGLRFQAIYDDSAKVVNHDELPCRRLPSANNVAVIMRTGATEIQDKLPVHFNTTFGCYNDLIIFSDYEETFNGYPIHDVLASLDSRLTGTNSDFEIYRRLKEQGRAGLRPEELSGSASFEGGKNGKLDNAGWRLDKWKFPVMMQETLRLRPDKDWYIFLETDSYVVYSNLLQWLKTLDPVQPSYYGSENQIGADIYAHGGSVFVLSRPAVEKAAEEYTKNTDKWNALTDRHWAGDCVLGMILLQAGIPLTWTWPMLQGGQPEKMDWTESKPPGKKLYCSPALSYHHFSSVEMERMWQFEQHWIRSRHEKAASEGREPWQEDMKDVLHHRDVFEQFVWPNVSIGERREWNSLSPELIVVKDDFDTCYNLCEQSAECLQFSVGPPGCSISTKQVTLGQRWADFRSYWVRDRVEDWMEKMGDCDDHDGWMVP